jgi:hypothetical protein
MVRTMVSVRFFPFVYLQRKEKTWGREERVAAGQEEGTRVWRGSDGY